MTDNKSPGDRVLELMVFGPTGLAVTLVEEFPKLVEKGRHRVEGQVHTARLVGQFAVQMGRRQLEQSLGHIGGRHEGPARTESAVDGAESPPAAVAHVATVAEQRPVAVTPPPADPTPPVDAPVPVPEKPVVRPPDAERRRAGDVARPPYSTSWGGGEHPATPAPWRTSPWTADGGPNGTASTSTLAIPGYDSLSASQVVQRLEGLSSAELEEVRVHETTHRQRRTILHRVEQLLTGGDGVAP